MNLDIKALDVFGFGIALGVLAKFNYPSSPFLEMVAFFLILTIFLLIGKKGRMQIYFVNAFIGVLLGMSAVDLLIHFLF